MITCDNTRRWRSKLFLPRNVSPGSNPLIGKKHCWYDEDAKDNDDYEEKKVDDADMWYLGPNQKGEDLYQYMSIY